MDDTNDDNIDTLDEDLTNNNNKNIDDDGNKNIDGSSPSVADQTSASSIPQKATAIANTTESLRRTAAPSPADSATADFAFDSSALSTVPLTAPVDRDFKSATFDDVTLDNTGTPIGIFGTPWSGIIAKHLRPLARDLKVRRYAGRPGD